MKKLIIIIFTFFVLINKASAISASSYVVMDMDNNNVLLSYNENNERLIASISKIMTSIIAIENGNLNDYVKADENILKATGSSIYIELGEEMRLDDLLYGLMLRSGNDAAKMIAGYISGDEAKFAGLMNEYAKKIGMKNTNFVNSSGLEEKGIGNTSTAYDMALLTSYAYKNETFRKIFSTKNYTCKSSKKTYVWQNKNKLLRYDYITGGKTGFTIKARRTLVSTANINNMNLVIVTLNDPNDWNDHLSLYEKIKNEYKRVKILSKNNFNVEGYYIKKDEYLIIRNNDIDNLYIKYFIDKDGGRAKVFNKENLLLDIQVYKKKISLFQRIKNYLKNIFKV